MTRKYSEGKVREALLGAMDLEDVYLFKPQDFPGASQNRKPADFLIWWRDERDITADVARSAWVEVKESPGAATFPLSDVRPSQVLAMRDAIRVGIPYWLVVYWPKSRGWTMTTGARVVGRLDGTGPPSFTRADFLADCPPAQLGSTLRACLLGEFDG